MASLAVCVQAGRVLEALPADRAGEPLALAVHKAVLGQVGGAAEGLMADGAVVGLVPAVAALVDPQSRGVGEAFLTQPAGELVLLAVHEGVSLQVGTLPESLPTFQAGVGEGGGMSLRAELRPARGAREGAGRSRPVKLGCFIPFLGALLC